MLKNLSLIALLGIAVVGVPSELCAKSVKVAGTQKGAAAKSITLQVAQQNVTIEFYSPSIVRILKSDAGLAAPVQKKSYSVILKPQQLKDVQIQENGDVVNIKSNFICVELNQQTGEIRFLSKDGAPCCRTSNRNRPPDPALPRNGSCCHTCLPRARCAYAIRVRV